MTPIRNQAARLKERYRADARRPVQAYATTTSAVPGGSLEFRVSVPSRGICSVAVRRFGTAMPTSAVRFVGEDQAPPKHSDGMTWCDWEPSLLLDIPESWPPGLYVARFSVEAPLWSATALRGRSAYVPFVVRAPWDAAFPTLVILPFAAYAARNPWPGEAHRAPSASFDRPYHVTGLPANFDLDTAFAAWVERWAEENGVDPAAYNRVLFRDDCWSWAMREAVTKAAAGGAGVALTAMPAVSVRFESSPDGRPDRVLRRL